MTLRSCKSKLRYAIEAIRGLNDRRRQVFHRLDHVRAHLERRVVRDRVSVRELFVLEDVGVKVFELVHATSLSGLGRGPVPAQHRRLLAATTHDEHPLLPLGALGFVPDLGLIWLSLHLLDLEVIFGLLLPDRQRGLLRLGLGSQLELKEALSVEIGLPPPVVLLDVHVDPRLHLAASAVLALGAAVLILVLYGLKVFALVAALEHGGRHRDQLRLFGGCLVLGFLVIRGVVESHVKVVHFGRSRFLLV